MSDCGLSWLADSIGEYLDFVRESYYQWCKTLHLKVCAESWYLFQDLYSDIIFPGQHSYISK